MRRAAGGRGESQESNADSREECERAVKEQREILKEALSLLVERCPRLVRQCYWAGTASVAMEELGHRESFDLDFHTRKALEDVRPILAEIEQAFPGSFEVLQAPDEFGSGFRGVLALPSGESVTVETLANYEETPLADLVPSTVAPGFLRVSLGRYLADKIQCVAERAEARDLVDLCAVLTRHPGLVATARRLVAEQDALLLAERLLAWTNEALEKDLRPYRDVTPADARQARDLLLAWVRSSAGG